MCLPVLDSAILSESIPIDILVPDVFSAHKRIASSLNRLYLIACRLVFRYEFCEQAIENVEFRNVYHVDQLMKLLSLDIHWTRSFQFL